MNWIKRTEEQPPKDSRFLILNEDIDLMEWRDQGGHEGYYYCSGCCCCTGYCTTDFEYWTRLPNGGK